VRKLSAKYVVFSVHKENFHVDFIIEVFLCTMEVLWLF